MGVEDTLKLSPARMVPVTAQSGFMWCKLPAVYSVVFYYKRALLIICLSTVDAPTRTLLLKT